MIENERKYILNLSMDEIKNIVEEYNGELCSVSQAYINDGRIRKTHKLINYKNINEFDSVDQKYIFTWKFRIEDGSMVEIETNITDDDFEKLWPYSSCNITKIRIKISIDDVVWDIDFLYDKNKKHYLTIAECEMPIGWEEPKSIPNFVAKNNIYLVPRDQDKTWTNKKLSNPKTVKKMIKSLNNG